mmetsp:Transcript_28443/g.58170  ORF Transcript_28443/g.58170 Transcript_28443/m.58170 type:complete len:353 (-) Transcript_28443:172-1230(-)|eukprot:CAMPEP_0171628234 /NCGR_PEP_ID=MMETSP0990-20121206/21301_1 /TAXON_ID=483369 /ORGANISM="non described non described, Strain CCMP2098" /LENGTH=352 /DNA_ID=CAMNT_0012196351 /DNA_START=221 /DNA_END=1279 /DNA_ORIENTATION=+
MWRVVPHVLLLGISVYALSDIPDEHLQQQRRLASTCTRWQTFGELGGINSLADLENNGWTTTFDWFNDPQYQTSPDWLQAFRGGRGNGYAEQVIPTGGDFVRVRWGCVPTGAHDSGELKVGGVTVGTASANIDVTTDAAYIKDDTMKLIENGISTVNIWSVDTCTYQVAAQDAAGSGSCFHADGTLMLEAGSSKRFSELNLGDRIYTSDGQGGFSFNPVLTLPHANNADPAMFLTLTTETGKKVALTSDHFIPKCNLNEVTASKLVVGDCLLSVDGNETLTEISSAVKYGVFTATTQDKFIVVDGVVASHFSKNSDPAKPELDYEKYRLELEQKRHHRLLKRLRGHRQKSGV